MMSNPHDRTKLIYDEKYIWVGGFGAVFQSLEENRVEKGTVRLIAGELFYAYMVNRRMTSLLSYGYEISWSFVDENKQNVEAIRALKHKAFGV